MRPQAGGPVAELVSAAAAEREECDWDWDPATGTLRISLPRMPPPPPPPGPGAPARPAAWTVSVLWEKHPAAPVAGSARDASEPDAAAAAAAPPLRAERESAEVEV